MERSKVIVRINGAEYTLKGDESEDYLFSIANYLDKRMKELLHMNPKHSNTSAAILTALTVTDELFKAKREVEVLKRSIAEPEERLSELRGEYRKLHDAYADLQREYESLMEMQNNFENEAATVKDEYNELYGSYMKKNDDFERLIRENAYLKEQNERLEKRLTETEDKISSLKDQLLENQIELVKSRKDLKDLKEIQNKKRGL